MEWSNEAVLEFLDLYEAEPVIWNPRNEQHKDRNQIYDAWRHIQKAFSMKCSVNELKTKKINLMATYRKLTTKVNRSKKFGEVYKPEWFAYDKMASFLHTVYTPRTNKEFESVEGVAVDEGEHCDVVANALKSEINEDSSCSIADLAAESPTTASYEHNEHDSSQFEPPTGKKRKSDILTSFAEPSAERDDCSLFCELLCLKLRALDEDTREVAMHEIDNLIFNLKRSRNLHVRGSLQQASCYGTGPQETAYQPPLYGGASSSQPSQVLISSSSGIRIVQNPLELPDQHNHH